MLPEYWLQRPNIEIDSLTRSDIDQWFARVKAAGTSTRIDYTFPVPKWQFLCYLADQLGVVLHGTGDPHIQVFEPRPSNDLNEFGAQTAVYAAGDGLWSMFFAILDRRRYPMSTSNACIRLVDEAGKVSEPQYVFSISQTALFQQPWRKGMIYHHHSALLPCLLKFILIQDIPGFFLFVLWNTSPHPIQQSTQASILLLMLSELYLYW